MCITKKNLLSLMLKMIKTKVRMLRSNVCKA